MDATESPLEKRTWVYLQPPKAYEVAPCACGNHDTHWSEFKGHLWCDKCQVDFKPAHNGVFDGPIPRHVSAMLGLRFDRLNLVTGRVERMDLDSGEYREDASTCTPSAQGQGQTMGCV